ncbi:MAG: hypothetical protein QM791_15315 [Ferruginibacter sp.]
MKKVLLLLFTMITTLSFAQQINGVFTDFAKNNEWANTVINTATLETSGYITLGGYYEGRSPERKVPMLLQINAAGAIRTEFSTWPFLMSFVNSSTVSNMVDKIYLANASSVVNSMQFIVAGHDEYEDGFLVKSFPTGSRPTTFNSGNIKTFDGGAASAKGHIEDWITGPFVYSVRMYGATFAEPRVLLTSFSKETGAPIINFGDSGILRIDASEGYMINASKPVRIIQPTTGVHTNKFYVAFSTIARQGPGGGIDLCRININGGTIDSSFGLNGFKSFSTSSAYHVTSILANSDESVTVGGYGGDGMQSAPSFFTFRTNESVAITSFSNLPGEPNPGLGSKNIAAKKATINGEERIVFAYALPINTNDQYRIAIASLTPGNGVGSDPLAHTPWLGSEFVSAEPTSIVTLSGSTGFIVTGRATRTNGSFAGVVLKYTSTGILDTSFGTQGVLVINGRTGGQQWNWATQLSNNKYMAVGGAEFISGNVQKKALLLSRFNSDGSIDKNFGTNGTLYRYESDYSRNGSNTLALPEGKFLVTGSYYNYQGEPDIGTNTEGNKATLYKFNEDGSTDYSFGPLNNGRYLYPIAGSSFGNLQLIGDNIYMSVNSSADFVMKLSSGGNLVNTYASGLSLIQDYALNETTGYLYTCGSRTGATPKQVCRANPSGTLDNSFGTDGYAAIPMINASDNNNVTGLKLTPGGKMLVTVQWVSSGNADYGVSFSSISEAGVVNMSFGTNGVKNLQLPGASKILAHRDKWVGQDNDRLMIFGQATVNNATQGFVCKVDLNGELDPAFGTGGVIWTEETFLGTLGFDNGGNALAIKDYGFYNGIALRKLNIPADVYNRIKTGSWTGTIDSDWFKPGNWAEGVVPDAYTEVIISNGSVLIGAGMHATAYSVRVLGGANLTLGQSATLTITKNNP